MKLLELLKIFGLLGGVSLVVGIAVDYWLAVETFATWGLLLLFGWMRESE